MGIGPDTVEANLQRGHVCWDAQDLIDGQPTGAVRASFGYMSSLEVPCLPGGDPLGRLCI